LAVREKVNDAKSDDAKVIEPEPAVLGTLVAVGMSS